MTTRGCGPRVESQGMAPPEGPGAAEDTKMSFAPQELHDLEQAPQPLFVPQFPFLCAEDGKGTCLTGLL